MTPSKTLSPELKAEFARRLSFINDAVALREIRGWPNTPAHNASIIYALYGWSFDERDAAMIREERRKRT